MTRDKDGKKPKTKRSARELLDQKRPVQHSFPIALDSRYRDELTEAEQALAKAEQRYRLNLVDDETWPAVHAELSAAVEEAQAAYDEHSQVFEFRALGRRQLDELMKDHAPTKEQLADFQARLKLNPSIAANGEQPYNIDTLPPALIHLTCVDPPFTLEEAQELWDSDAWSDAECAMIQNAAWAVQKLVK